MSTALLLAFVAAIAAPLVHRVAPRWSHLLSAAAAAAGCAYFVRLGLDVASGPPRVETVPWAPGLGLDLALRLDGLSALFAVLVTGVGAAVFLYAGPYMRGFSHVDRFFGVLWFFLASMLGLVLADDAIGLFLFWELTSVASFLLIGHEHRVEAARAAARTALLVTSAGGLALLAGLLLLSQATGTMRFSSIVEAGGLAEGHPLLLPIVLLLCFGAFTKSAQAPFHFWLPAAMAAPTPVSAYLHSATMVKAGVYLLARLNPAFQGSELWGGLLVVVGGGTALGAGAAALLQRDLKRVLAYSTGSLLGTLVLLIGLGTPTAIQAMIVLLVAHALYKGASFMVVGVLDHGAGTRDTAALGGLLRAMPITAAVAFAAALSLAGVGPTASFIGKEALLQAVLDAPSPVPLVVVVVLVGGLFVAVALILFVRPFFGPRRRTRDDAHDPSPAMWLAPAALAALGLLFGGFPSTLSAVVGPAAAAVLGEAEPMHLALWHGLNLAFALTVASVALGLLAFVARGRALGAAAPLRPLTRYGPAAGFEAVVEGTSAFAASITRLLQNGSLRRYLWWTLATVLALTTWVLVRGDVGLVAYEFDDARASEIIVAAVMVGAALVAPFLPSRLSAVAALGVIGYGLSLVFVFFSAPDLAMTQVLVETLTVIVFVLVFHHLPKLEPIGLSRLHAADVLLACSIGLVMAIIVLVAGEPAEDIGYARFVVEQAVPAAHGHNVVNVVLVDFRALDTLGEATVLAVAGLGVFSLLKLRPAARPAGPQARAAAPAAGEGA